MKAIILLAGYATRLYPLTENMPKALLEIGGKTILDYIADEVETIEEINEVILVTNDRFYPDFVTWAKKANEEGKKKYTPLNDLTTNADNRLGAVADIWFTIENMKIDEDIVVIAGDNLFTYKLQDSFDVFKKEGKDLVLAQRIDSVEELRRMAVGILDENNIIVDLEEKPEEPKSNIAFFATYFYRRETLPLIKQYLDEGNPPDAPGHFPAWLYKRQPVMAHLFDGACYDIGTFKALEEARELFS